MPTRVPPGLGRYRGTFVGAALIALFAAIALLRPILGLYIHTPPEHAVVETVIDGDTVILTDGRHVRYLGMDTPEMNAHDAEDRRLAEEAKEFNTNLVLGRRIRLEFDTESKDKYGRTLAYVWVGDDLVNATIVEAGLARAKNYGTKNLIWWDKLVGLESKAKAAHRGIWAKKHIP